jgi:hypothetical protein
MMQNYPVKFDLVYGFECENDLSDLSAHKGSVEHCIRGTPAETAGYDVDEVMSSFKFYYNYIGLKDDATTHPPTLGVSQFLRDNGVTEDDFVVMKMDVEELEFDLLKQFMEDGTYRLLDEVRMGWCACLFGSSG